MKPWLFPSADAVRNPNPACKRGSDGTKPQDVAIHRSCSQYGTYAVCHSQATNVYARKPLLPCLLPCFFAFLRAWFVLACLLAIFYSQSLVSIRLLVTS